MRLLAAASLLALTLPLAAAPLDAKPARSTVRGVAADARFASLAQRFIASATRLSPTEATTLGEHRYDALLPDISADGRAARAAEWFQILGDTRPDQPRRTQPRQPGRCRDARQCAALRSVGSRTLQDWAWDAQIYNDIAGGALYGLAARDFAPWPQRLRPRPRGWRSFPRCSPRPRGHWSRRASPRVFAKTVHARTAASSRSPSTCSCPTRASWPPPTRPVRRRARHAQSRGRRASEMARQGTRPPGQGRVPSRRRALRPEDEVRAPVSTSAAPRSRPAPLVGEGHPRRDVCARPGRSRRLTDRPDAPSAEQQQKAIEAALTLSYAKRPSARS